MSVLEVSNLYRSFGGNMAVNNLNMTLEEGKITTLIGPNGAGKTTAFNLITGFLSADQGQILYRGKKITNLASHKIAQMGVIRSFQNLRLFGGLTVLDNVILANRDHRGEKIGTLFFLPRMAKKAELETKEKALDILEQLNLLGKKETLVKNLSYGEMKLLVLARIFMAEPEVILLDEVLAGLDRTSVDDLIKVILRLKNMGKTICVIEHNVEVLKRISDIVLFLHQGTVIAKGEIQTLLQDKELTELYFGNPVMERGA